MFELRAWRRACGTALVVLACTVAARAQTAQLDDAGLRRAWSFMTESEQDDALARFEAEAQYVDTFQNKLLRFALKLEERDHSFLPDETEPPFFDPTVHAPGQPIARHRLADDAPAALRAREQMFAKVPARKLRPTWRYDWPTGEVVHRDAGDARKRGFENALAGFLPDLDLAEALVERALDDGKRRKELAAFGHAYTDRLGAVFPGITLYDAWASGADMEMPDVDVLGIVHELQNEWKRWIAPVPPMQQDELYETVGKLFVSAHHYRGLRTALARTYLSGSVELRDGYAFHIDRLHALWDAHASTPSEIAALLPDSDKWAEFMESWTLQCEEHPNIRDAGLVRHAQLDRDSAVVRGFFAEILKDSGALERTTKPAPHEPKRK